MQRASSEQGRRPSTVRLEHLCESSLCKQSVRHAAQQAGGWRARPPPQAGTCWCRAACAAAMAASARARPASAVASAAARRSARSAASRSACASCAAATGSARPGNAGPAVRRARAEAASSSRACKGLQWWSAADALCGCQAAGSRPTRASPLGGRLGVYEPRDRRRVGVRVQGWIRNPLLELGILDLHVGPACGSRLLRCTGSRSSQRTVISCAFADTHACLGGPPVLGTVARAAGGTSVLRLGARACWAGAAAGAVRVRQAPELAAPRRLVARPPVLVLLHIPPRCSGEVAGSEPREGLT
jgi:hypothetical protein